VRTEKQKKQKNIFYIYLCLQSLMKPFLLGGTMHAPYLMRKTANNQEKNTTDENKITSDTHYTLDPLK
jgi:hypothetical protein